MDLSPEVVLLADGQHILDKPAAPRLQAKTADTFPTLTTEAVRTT